MLAVGGQLEPEQEPVEQRCAGSAYEEISFKLWSQAATSHKANRRRRQSIFPTKFRIEIPRTLKHVHSGYCLLRGCRNVARRPTELLKVFCPVSHLDRSELSDTAGRPHRLYPATVEAWCDAIDFIERIVAVLLRPQGAAQ